VAPEVLGKDGYDGKKADVWSIGVILYVLLAGYLPFDENTMAALFQKIKNADFEYPDWFSAEARDLLSKILIPDPHNRAKISELKNHPWMQHGDSGPTPSAGSNAAAMSGAPAVVNTHPTPHTSNTPPPAVVKPTVTVHHESPPSPSHPPAAATTTTATPAVTQPPHSQPAPAPKSSSGPVHRSPPPASTTTTTQSTAESAHPPTPPQTTAAPAVKPLEVQQTPSTTPSVSPNAPTKKAEPEVVGGGGLCGCFGGGKKQDNKQYDRV
jgi:serine/threonine protein kinase